MRVPVLRARRIAPVRGCLERGHDCDVRDGLMSASLSLARPAVASGSEEQPSMRSRMRLLLGQQRKALAAIAVIAIVSTMVEAVTLALLAQIAASLVRGGQSHVRLSLVHIHATTKTLIICDLIIVLLRVPLLQVPGTIIPARMLTGLTARVRTDLFNAYSRSSWEVQSRDREGQVQETMTNQVGQATSCAGSFVGLINSTLTFLVLLASAFALSPYSAVIVLALAISMFALLRPLRGLGMRRARAWSQAQVNFASGVAEAIRLAQETQVFGAGAVQRRLNDRRVAITRKLLFQTQLISKIGGSISETIVYLLLLVGLVFLRGQHANHIGQLGAVVLIIVRASSSGQGIQGSYQELIQAMPFLERVQDAERRYRGSIPVVGSVSLPSVRTLAFEHVGYEYR
ncbi:MAG: hypothetical protein ACRD6W_15425, partial [Nitrososphaerales archaeon]